jgi:hypothetical protein
MILFSAQRCTHFFRSIGAIFCAILVTGLFGLTAQAQSSDALFRGTWQIETPDQGALILIVKSQNRASYFWGDNTDRTVYPGSWSSSGETATLNWSDGSAHRIERDALGYTISKLSPSGTVIYSAKAQQIPEEVLGQWAKPPTEKEALASDRDKAKGFFGVWKIGAENIAAEYVFIEPDRSAATTAGPNNGLRGSWAKQGSELHIAWESGQYSILRPENRGFIYKTIEAGQIIENDESEMLPAERTIEDKLPANWLSQYRAEREIHTGGIAFSSRKSALEFYRGDWIVKLSENKFERISINRFGSLKNSSQLNLEGDWRMQGQDLFMRWDDGMRKILSPIGRGFVLYEYKPGRPLDGVPTRTLPAAPTDSAKLAEHLAGRDEVAQQIISLSEAAGINPSAQENAGWGRTFARWAWPFGKDEPAPSTDEIIQEEYEAASDTDPWWWPFWSEKPESAQEEAKPMQTEITSSADPSPTETIDTAQNTAETAKQESKQIEEATPSKRNWVWPF